MAHFIATELGQWAVVATSGSYQWWAGGEPRGAGERVIDVALSATVFVMCILMVNLQLCNGQ